MAKNNIELHISRGTKKVAYVSLPGHPGRGTPGATTKQIRLKDFYPAYKGADLYFDFDQDSRLIGIEILV